MWKLIYLLSALLLLWSKGYSQKTITLIDSGIFYDGYAALVSQPTPSNVFRLKNDVLTTQISPQNLKQMKGNLSITAEISALCDNYDRIGNINLALVPKGDTSYNFKDVVRIELGRFITPFMNKNIEPTTVSYSFSVPQLAQIIQSKELQKKYDFWMELELFGVPYAAQKEVKGCTGRNDVFTGTLKVTTSSEQKLKKIKKELVPIIYKHRLNNYDVGHSDSIGLSTKTYEFNLPKNCINGQFVVITSNHGANENGEEYVRRLHHIYLDTTEVLSYTPGGKSCEPYRKHNTQGNGIYESTPKTEEEWTSWNNWCPGDVIPIRTIEVDKLKAGKHSIQVAVPEAQFADKQGYFPVSIYFIGTIGFKNKEQ